jgi:hypothetical protein
MGRPPATLLSCHGLRRRLSLLLRRGRGRPHVGRNVLRGRGRRVRLARVGTRVPIGDGLLSGNWSLRKRFYFPFLIGKNYLGKNGLLSFAVPLTTIISKALVQNCTINFCPKILSEKRSNCILNASKKC